MTQRSQMFYAYFRFYIDEDDIEAGLEQYCSEWEHMFEVGYNYKEYKCFADDIGGFEHWVGDMQGYISPTREIGFMDASPGDSVYDSSLLMGKQKITETNIIYMNAVKQGIKIIFRKITAQDAGVANKIKFESGVSAISHPVMYTFDSSQMEILKPAANIIDSSDVDSYEYVVDIGVDWIPHSDATVDSCDGTYTDFANMIDGGRTTYGQYNAVAGNTYKHMIIDIGKTFSAIAIHAENIDDSSANPSTSIVAVSADKITWYNLGADSGAVNGVFIRGENDNGDLRYVRLSTKGSAVARSGKVRLYQILIS